MAPVLAVLLGAVLGFVGSRALRRPQRVAHAASAARTIGGSFGRRALTPPELQRACFSEMVRHVRATRGGTTQAPSHYVLRLHPDDLAVVDETRRWFTDGLCDGLRQAAKDNSWRLDGPVVIAYEADPGRRPGVPNALAVAPGGTPDRPSSGPPATALSVVRVDTGERVPLVDEAVTVGRSRDRSITVDDDRVSRRHARIERGRAGWTVIDEGSANGTRLDGRPLAPNQPHPLVAGSVVGVGPVELRIDVAPPVTSEPGTRALDDRTRARISAEVLPPDPDRP